MYIQACVYQSKSVAKGLTVLIYIQKLHYSRILEEFDQNKDQKSRWFHLLSFSSLRDWLQGT